MKTISWFMRMLIIGPLGAFLIFSISSWATGGATDIPDEAKEATAGVGASALDKGPVPGQYRMQRNINDCLGSEQYFVHRSKIEGPIFHLNQEVFNEVAKIDLFPMKPNHLSAICQSRDLSPSLKFLELIIRHGEELFEVPAPQDRKTDYKAIQRYEQLQSLLYFSSRVFIRYLTNLSAMMPTEDCLVKNFAELGPFLERYQYLENENINYQQVFNTKDVDKIFLRLRQIDDIYSRCEQTATSMATPIKNQ